MTAFVLVHGAFHGEWCWSEVAGRLRAAGHRVLAPTLAGVGERHREAAAGINLTTHIDEVVGLFDDGTLDGAVLVGHSYGGMVISGAAARLGGRIGCLVYLDALLPEDGQSLFDVVGPETALYTIATAAADGIMVPAPSAEFFDLDPANRETVTQRMTPHPLATFIEAVHLTGRERDVARRTYIFATGYRFPTHRLIADRLRGTPGSRIEQIDCGHDVMIDRPVELADLLLGEAGRGTL